MIAPAGQSTARAGLRSKLAALVVRRQAPPNPRRGKKAPLSKGAGRVSGLGDSDGLCVTAHSRATARPLRRGGLPPSLAPFVRNSFTVARRGRACPARDFAMPPVNGLSPSGLLRGHLP